MRNWSWVGLLLGIVAAAGAGPSFAQAPVSFKESPRDAIRDGAFQWADPGGMLFHTAFHGEVTTRYLLLKTAVHSKEVAKNLRLDEQQILRIKSLKPIPRDLPKPSDKVDRNDQPDEQIEDPEYFGFLRPDQLGRLDVLALNFDGYCALSRKSLAMRLELCEASQTEIAQTITNYRKLVFMPRFRWRFAARPENDSKFRDCQFAGSFCTQVNLKIIDALTDEECRRFQAFLATGLDAEMRDTINAVERLAPLPEGLANLRKFLEDDR